MPTYHKPCLNKWNPLLQHVNIRWKVSLMEPFVVKPSKVNMPISEHLHEICELRDSSNKQRPSHRIRYASYFLVEFIMLSLWNPNSLVSLGVNFDVLCRLLGLLEHTPSSGRDHELWSALVLHILCDSKYTHFWDLGMEFELQTGGPMCWNC